MNATTLKTTLNTACRMLCGSSCKQTRDFTYITFSDLKIKAESPVTLPVTSEVQALPDLLDRLKALKTHAPIVAPHDAVSKGKHDAVKNDHFTMLAIDIDKGNKSLNDIRSALKSDGIASFVIHSTGTSTPENKKWRVLIEISESIDSEHWLTLQQYLCYLFEADSSVARKQQILFLPFKSDLTVHYEYFLGDGEPLDVGGSFAANAITYREKQEKEALQEAKKAQPAQRQSLSLTRGQVSPIDAYNESHSLPELLRQYGFKKVGKKYLHPDSKSGIAGVILLDGRYYSHHSADSDPLADNHTHDAFDLFIQFEHGGDYLAALKAAGEMLTPEGISITQANQRAYKADQELSQPVKFEALPASEPEPEELLNPCAVWDILSSTKLGQFIGDVADFLQFPRDTATLTALGIVSSAVSMRYAVCFKHGTTKPTGLYVVTEQPPSTGKSSVLEAFELPIAKAINEMNNAIATANELDGQKEPPFYKAFITDATPEALESILHGNFGHFCMASAEQGIVNSMLGVTYGDGGQKGRKSNKDLILKGYSGEWHSSVRTTRKGYSGKVYGAVTVIAQEQTIDTILEQSDGTGVAERFLMLSEPSLLGYRDHTKARPERDGFLELAYRTAVEKLIDEYKATVLRDSFGYENLHCLHLPAACWDQIHSHQQQIESMIKNGGRYAHSVLRGAAGKFDQRVMKIAAVLHVIESLMNGERIQDTIKGEYVRMASEITLLSFEQLYQALNKKGLIGRTAEQDAIYRMVCKYEDRGIRWADLHNQLKNIQPFKSYASTGKADKIKEVLKDMVDIGMLALEQVNTGRRSTYKYYAR